MKYPHPVFGWKPYRLADLSFEALNELRDAIVSDPASANPQYAAGRSIYLYTPSTRKKLNALAWAVTAKLAETKRGAA